MPLGPRTPPWYLRSEEIDPLCRAGDSTPEEDTLMIAGNHILRPRLQELVAATGLTVQPAVRRRICLPVPQHHAARVPVISGNNCLRVNVVRRERPPGTRKRRGPVDVRLLGIPHKYGLCCAGPVAQCSLLQQCETSVEHLQIAAPVALLRSTRAFTAASPVCLPEIA